MKISMDRCCFDCIDKRELTKDYQVICDAVSDAVCDEYAIDIFIIYLIADYAKGVVIECSNTVKQCQNEIVFKSQHHYEEFTKASDSRMNHIKMYHYEAKCIRE